MSEDTRFVLSAARLESAAFEDLFSRTSSAREMLEHPGELRFAGFDMQPGARLVLFAVSLSRSGSLSGSDCGCTRMARWLSVRRER